MKRAVIYVIMLLATALFVHGDSGNFLTGTRMANSEDYPDAGIYDLFRVDNIKNEKRSSEGPRWWTRTVRNAGPRWWTRTLRDAGPRWWTRTLRDAGPRWWTRTLRSAGPRWWTRTLRGFEPSTNGPYVRTIRMKRGLPYERNHGMDNWTNRLTRKKRSEEAIDPRWWTRTSKRGLDSILRHNALRRSRSSQNSNF